VGSWRNSWNCQKEEKLGGAERERRAKLLDGQIVRITGIGRNSGTGRVQIQSRAECAIKIDVLLPCLTIPMHVIDHRGQFTIYCSYFYSVTGSSYLELR